MRLTEVARLATGHTPSRRCPEYWNGDVPWLQLPDIRAVDGRRIYHTAEQTNALGIQNSAAVLLPEGTVCLSRTASVGFVTVLGRPMATSQDFVNWVCGPELSPDFLMWLFVACRKSICALSSGAIHQTIYFPTVRDFGVCIPGVPEQERIAARLTDQLAAVERARAAAQARLAAAEALPGAYLRDAFERREWPEAELKSCLRAIEAGTSVQSLERPPREGEWGVLKVSAVSWGRFREDQSKAVPPSYEPREVEKVREGDLIISRANTSELAGAIVLVREAPERRMLSDKTLRLVLREDVAAPEYLEYALRTRRVRRFIEGNATGTSSSMRNISQETIRAIPVTLPPIGEQRRLVAELAERLEGAGRVVARARDELGAFESLPDALLREAFGSGGGHG